MAIFLDSGFFLGLVHPKDKNRERSLQILDELNAGAYGQLFTSIYIMAEAATLTAARSRSNAGVISLLRKYFTGDLQIASYLYSSPSDDVSTWDLFEKVNSERGTQQPISFIDCNNIILCEKYLVQYILSFDSHFDPWLTRIS